MDNYYDQNGVRYFMAGTGRSLLFLHGFGLSPASYLPVLEKLATQYRVIAPDLSLGWAAEDLIAMVRKHKIDKDLIIVGHSMGAFAAVQLIHEYPVICSHLIIANGLLLSLNKNIIHTVYDLIRGKIKKLTDQEIRQQTILMAKDTAHNFIRHPKEVARVAKLCLKVDAKKLLSEIKAKTLLLWGRQDTVIPLSKADEIQALIPGSVLHIQESGHSWLIESPATLLKEIQDFCL